MLERGGNVAIVLGPKWRFHYYAHLKDINTSTFHFVKAGSEIGTVGTTGNAAGKPPHLHYSVSSLLPLPWRIDGAKQGWKKMFYLNPVSYLKEVE
jgi:murein DD-endopeptidase MepM/ murein hydrolase activator NlpD